MRYYLAPMEGITTHIYRNAYHHWFYPMDKYFTPFIVPHIHKEFNAKELRELLPENNQGMELVPQILTNNSEDFVRTSLAVQRLGYEEVNLNLGCPSKTVVSKGRGSGFLADVKKLDEFLEDIFEKFEKSDMKISIKTRLGMEFPAEFEELLAVYNKYPLEELIIHSRVQKDYYKNVPDREMFAWAVGKSKNSLCYNGDLFETQDLTEFQQQFPQVGCVMLGRGIMRNPGLLQELKSGSKMSRENLRGFHDEIYKGYQEICSGERNVLFKMKELWSYLIESFPEECRKKMGKKIKKAEKLVVYDRVVEELFGFYK